MRAHCVERAFRVEGGEGELGCLWASPPSHALPLAAQRSAGQKRRELRECSFSACGVREEQIAYRRVPAPKCSFDRQAMEPGVSGLVNGATSSEHHSQLHAP